LPYTRFCNCLLDYDCVLHIVNFAILYISVAYRCYGPKPLVVRYLLTLILFSDQALFPVAKHVCSCTHSVDGLLDPPFYLGTVSVKLSRLHVYFNM
jgi:hypothetical protein